MIIYACKDKPIDLIGYVGENETRKIAFPIAGILNEFPTAIATVMHQRHGDAEPYPCVTTQDDQYAYWTVSEADVSIVGRGMAQLTFVVDETKVGKSQIYQTITKKSLGEPGEVPEPYEDWVNTVVAAGTTATTKAAEALKSANDASGFAKSASDDAKTANDAAKTATDAVNGFDAHVESKKTEFNVYATETTSTNLERVSDRGEEYLEKLEGELREEENTIQSYVSHAVEASQDAQRAKGAAEKAQGLAESARDDAQSALSDAQKARDDAQSAADTATTMAGNASKSADSAGKSETNAGKSEAAAKGYAETAKGYAETVSTVEQRLADGERVKIIQDPSDGIGYIGGTVDGIKISQDRVNYHVEAVGDGLTYQWYYSTDGTKWSKTTLSGYLTATLIVPATTGRSGNYYRCTVTDAQGYTATSRAALFTASDTPYTLVQSDPIAHISDMPSYTAGTNITIDNNVISAKTAKAELTDTTATAWTTAEQTAAQERLGIIKLTQEEYDLIETPVESTIYIIVEDES